MWDDLAKFITALPPPAAYIFVSMLAIVVGVSWRGILQGRKLDPGKDLQSAQVAAVIVDPTALNNATAALIRHTVVMEKVAEVENRLAEEIDRVREEIRDLAREIARRPP